MMRLYLKDFWKQCKNALQTRNTKRIKNIEQQIQALSNQTRMISSLHHLSSFLNKPQKQTISKNRFILFDYSLHSAVLAFYNLGDYIQTIATKNALDTIFANNSYEFFNRDSLSFYTSQHEIGNTPDTTGGGG